MSKGAKAPAAPPSGVIVPPFGDPPPPGLFTEQQIEVFREIFLVFDKDEDGFVSTKDLGPMLRAVVQNPTKSEIKEMVLEMDPKQIGNRIFDFQMFLQYIVRRVKEYDTEEELREATLGEPFTDEEMSTLLKDAKVNSEGNINYEGLIKMMMKK